MRLLEMYFVEHYYEHNGKKMKGEPNSLLIGQVHSNLNLIHNGRKMYYVKYSVIFMHQTMRKILQNAEI